MRLTPQNLERMNDTRRYDHNIDLIDISLSQGFFLKKFTNVQSQGEEHGEKMQ
jgi:hypothetical protein